MQALPFEVLFLYLRMTNTELEKLRFPIGPFNCPDQISEKHIEDWIHVLDQFPKRLEQLVDALNDDQLDATYRPGGWTIRQVIHHVADNHQHSYIRFKWALTEDKRVIKYYYEDRWAALDDADNAPIKLHINHLKSEFLKLFY